MTETWMKSLRPGIDFDLVNISLIGHDPVTGKSYEECADEWKNELERLQARCAKLRWWQIRERLWLARQTNIMSQRQGMHGLSF